MASQYRHKLSSYEQNASIQAKLAKRRQEARDNSATASSATSAAFAAMDGNLTSVFPDLASRPAATPGEPQRNPMSSPGSRVRSALPAGQLTLPSQDPAQVPTPMTAAPRETSKSNDISTAVPWTIQSPHLATDQDPVPPTTPENSTAAADFAGVIMSMPTAAHKHASQLPQDAQTLLLCTASWMTDSFNGTIDVLRQDVESGLRQLAERQDVLAKQIKELGDNRTKDKQATEDGLQKLTASTYATNSLLSELLSRIGQSQSATSAALTPSPTPNVAKVVKESAKAKGKYCDLYVEIYEDVHSPSPQFGSEDSYPRRICNVRNIGEILVFVEKIFKVEAETELASRPGKDCCQLFRITLREPPPGPLERTPRPRHHFTRVDWEDTITRRIVPSEHDEFDVEVAFVLDSVATGQASKTTDVQKKLKRTVAEAFDGEDGYSGPLFRSDNFRPQ